jgi:hypothetical protein
MLIMWDRLSGRDRLPDNSPKRPREGASPPRGLSPDHAVRAQQLHSYKKLQSGENQGNPVGSDSAPSPANLQDMQQWLCEKQRVSRLAECQEQQGREDQDTQAGPDSAALPTPHSQELDQRLFADTEEAGIHPEGLKTWEVDALAGSPPNEADGLSDENWLFRVQKQLEEAPLPPYEGQDQAVQSETELSVNDYIKDNQIDTMVLRPHDQTKDTSYQSSPERQALDKGKKEVINILSDSDSESDDGSTHHQADPSCQYDKDKNVEGIVQDIMNDIGTLQRGHVKTQLYKRGLFDKISVKEVIKSFEKNWLTYPINVKKDKHSKYESRRKTLLNILSDLERI